MKIINNVPGMRRYINAIKRRGDKLGFVPTMGCLHEGHLSLLRAAKRECGVCVISIFVNPSQFGPKEDFKKYPRNIRRDLKLAKASGADCVFIPSAKEVYPNGYLTYVNVDKLSGLLCGASRPGHFRGVATVVAKLFNIAMPDAAYFGQKDAQQARIIEKMAEDLNMPLKIRVMPTVREVDGLAMSSRNIYLNKQERNDAGALYRSLMLAKRLIKNGERNASKIISEMKSAINEISCVRIDYIEIVSKKNLGSLKKIKGEVLIALAVRIGGTRLIDNMVLTV